MLLKSLHHFTWFPGETKSEQEKSQCKQIFFFKSQIENTNLVVLLFLIILKPD